MAQAQPEEIRANAYVGFETITRQIEHKLLKRGFQFNVIVVGTSSSQTWLGLAPLGVNRFLTLILFVLRRSNWFGKVDVD
jgi:hypothetical protein